MRRSEFLGMLLLSMGLGAVALVSGPAQGSQASGGGTYFVEPGVRSEFQFSSSHVQCKIGNTVFVEIGGRQRQRGLIRDTRGVLGRQRKQEENRSEKKP